MGFAVVCLILCCVGLAIMTIFGLPASMFVVPVITTGVLAVVTIAGASS